jgi:hypothetical protein
MTQIRDTMDAIGDMMKLIPKNSTPLPYYTEQNKFDTVSSSMYVSGPSSIYPNPMQIENQSKEFNKINQPSYPTGSSVLITNDKHSKINIYACIICPSKFSRAQDLKGHITKKHKITDVE